LEKYLFSVFGRDMGVRNDATKLAGGNKSVRDLKRETALKEQRALDAQTEQIKKEQRDLDKQTKQMKAELLKVISNIEGLKITDGGIKVIKEKRGQVVISKEDLERAAEALVKKYHYENKAQDAERRAKSVEQEADRAVNRDYEKEIKDLKNENWELADRNNYLYRNNKKYSLDSAVLKELLEYHPELKTLCRDIKDELEGGAQAEME